jgi:hypothetical protein
MELKQKDANHPTVIITLLIHLNFQTPFVHAVSPFRFWYSILYVFFRTKLGICVRPTTTNPEGDECGIHMPGIQSVEHLVVKSS